MRFTRNTVRFDDVPPTCVCAEYEGAQHPVFCKACHDWTDNIVAWMVDTQPAASYREKTQQILSHARRIKSVREELVRELAALGNAEVA